MTINILKILAADLNQFDAQVRERVARAAASAPVGASTQENSGLSFYYSDPLEESTNALGHLADPGAVVRVTALVSKPTPCGHYGQNLDVQGQDQLQEADPSCVSIARLVCGDQTVVFPTPDAAICLPSAGVYVLKLSKRAVHNFPDDALAVQRVGVTRKGPAATPWLLDNLGLPHGAECDLHRVLASMKPVHQAVFMAAISRPDIEHKLTANVAGRSATNEGASSGHTLSCGIRAAVMLEPIDLQRDEASLTRLACLISDLGELTAPERLPGLASNNGYGPKSEVSEADTRCAHPLTATFLGALIKRFEELEQQDAADLLELLGQEPFWPYRVGSKRGPLSANPMDPVLSRMGCALGDALSQVRESMVQVRTAPVGTSDKHPDLFANADSKNSASQVSLAQVSAPSDSIAEFAELKVESQSTGDGLPKTRQPEEGGEPAGDAVGECGSNALAVSEADPLQRLSGLRADLDRCNDMDAPRPSLEWAAGMLDGDGCIAVIRQPFRNRRPIYRLIVSIVQNCRQTLEHFRRCVDVDGVIYDVKRKLEHNKQVYTLNYSGPKALLVIQRLRAYLVRKRLEALVAISFCLNGQISRRFGPRGVPTDVEAVRVAHYLKLRALK
ncbi:MAG: hypothetical protein PSV40_09195 [Polaromonas sp.]|uniref:hypothetical protein n=1 Tax=Polaromonas sp. TaxID=1869339 RepID=UPI0024873DBD|nr:hypothetical protein [Polaromonas sp.]MDI1269259.1 hypothetical protein [Polaromonas sp.]